MKKYRHYMLSLSLMIPMFYHGCWNVSPMGAEWWGEVFSTYSWLRFPAGIIEILTGIGLFIPQIRQISSIIIVILMAGAVYFHIEAGYSFKNNGFETPLSYMMVALAICMEGSQRENKTIAGD